MRILVCGGREFDNWALLSCTLDYEFDIRLRENVVIHGDAKGADFLASVWAVDRGVEEERYPADWKKYGKSAGVIRNQQMLDEGKPDLVIAFPGGRGTADMISRAQKDGVKVEVIS